MNRIIVFLCCGTFLLITSCVNRIKDDCTSIEMYDYINVVFKDSTDFINAPIDSIKINIIRQQENKNSIFPANIILKEVDSIKALYTLKIDDIIDSQTAIELRLNNKTYLFTEFDYGKKEIETLFGNAYETCLLRGCKINGKYHDNFQLFYYNK